jgi:hypothetical protein
MPMMMALPMSALKIPPPVSPTGFGRFIRKLQLIAEMPLLKI